MSDLLDKKCVPCEGGVKAFDISEIHKYQKKVDGWEIVQNDKKVYLLEKKFEFKTKIKKTHLNKAGITHGGYICTIIDAGAGTACHRASGNKPCVTISLDIKFIAPSNIGDELLGTVEIQKVTKSMVFINCKLKYKNKLIASAVGIWKILRRPLPNAGLGG